MERRKSYPIALGGLLAALAVVMMTLGGMIPASTFVCPMLAMVLLKIVAKQCTNRIAWAWYAAVAILGVLLSPDKEAAAVFVFLGYYPLVKPKLDRLPIKWLWKELYFNSTVLVMYWLLMNLFGMAQIAAEFAEMGTWMTVITLVLGNGCFVLLDILLSRKFNKKSGCG